MTLSYLLCICSGRTYARGVVNVASQFFLHRWSGRSLHLTHSFYRLERIIYLATQGFSWGRGGAFDSSPLKASHPPPLKVASNINSYYKTPSFDIDYTIQISCFTSLYVGGSVFLSHTNPLVLCMSIDLLQVLITKCIAMYVHVCVCTKLF